MPKFIDFSQIKDINKALRKLPNEFTKKQRKEWLGKGAEPVLEAVREEVPVSTKSHLGFDSKQDETGKQKLRRFKPGTLKRSINIMTFRRSPDVFVGPLGRKRTRAKKVKGQRFSKAKNNLAYYWTFVYYGTMYQTPNHFTDRGALKSEEAALGILKKEGEKIIDNYIKKNGLG